MTIGSRVHCLLLVLMQYWYNPSPTRVRICTSRETRRRRIAALQGEPKDWKSDRRSNETCLDPDHNHNGQCYFPETNYTDTCSLFIASFVPLMLEYMFIYCLKRFQCHSRGKTVKPQMWGTKLITDIFVS